MYVNASCCYDSTALRCARLLLRVLGAARPLGQVHVVEVGSGAGGASIELSKEVGELNVIRSVPGG